MKTKRIVSALLAVMTVISIISCAAFTSSAANTTAFSKITSSAYAKAYTLSSSGKLTTVYTSSTLKTRGTVTYGASSSSYIDCANDELYIYKIAKNSSGTYYAYLSYPTSSKRAYAYVPLSKITPNSASSSSKKSTGKFYCAPRNGGTISSSYYVDKGDTVYLLTSTSSTAQIMYPISSGKWRIAFCKLSDYNKYCSSSSSSSSTSSKASYTGYVNTNSSPLVLRKSASTSAAAITNMPKGSSLTVLDNKAKTNGFYHVKYNGSTGYASASYITFTKPVNKNIYLNVPLYKQADSRWAKTYIGSKTIGAVGCTTTCLAMIYSYKTGATYYPNAVMKKLKYSNNDLYWSSLSNIGMSYSNAYNCTLNNDIMKTIYSKLSSGKPVMIGCNGASREQHWVVVKGYTGTSTTNFSASDFIINDPGGANDTTLAGFVKSRGTVSRLAW